MPKKKKNEKYLNNDEQLPIRIDYEYSAHEVEELRKCKEDILYFAEKYFYIINLDEGRQIIKLYDKQKEAITKIVNNRRTIICASRQTGKTSLMTIVCLWYTIFNPDFTVAILANKEEIAKEILERVQLAYTELPNWLKSGVWAFTKELIKLTNNSKIVISTTSLSSIRGKSVNLLFVDEFAHISKEIADAFFKSVMPTLSSSKKSKMVIVSTPAGTGNRYYQLWSSAEAGKNNWIPVRIHYSQVPDRDEEWKQDQLKTIDYDWNLWNQEFELHFLDDGISALNGALLEKLKLMCFVPEYTFDQGEYKIFKQPKKNHIYCVGVDVSEGVGQDFSVAQILDVTDPREIEQVAIYATNKIQPYVFAEKLNQVIRSWGRPFVCVERNGPGGQVIDALFNIHNYDNVVYYTMENSKKNSVYSKLGINCTANSKALGILNMKYYVEHLESVRMYDIGSVKEFETFTRKENGKWAAKEGFHDDRVMALIWALMILEIDLAEKYLNVDEYDESGKVVRISDPNIDISNALMSEYNKETVSNYARTGASTPLPTLYMNGAKGDISFKNNSDTDAYIQQGWKLM